MGLVLIITIISPITTITGIDFSMDDFYEENDISIVHSHFELYDMPATIMASKKTKIYWHLHDPINVTLGLRGILWKMQYGFFGKRAKLLAVSEYYRKKVIAMGFPEINTKTILNSIDLERINSDIIQNNKKYTFLTFGWDFYRKGDDILLTACDQLQKDGYKFRLLLNGNDQTWKKLDSFFDGSIPDYLCKGNPVSDVNILFDNSEVFIQASRRETFSYAVCEAAYAGLPVICSDIEGLEWAHQLASVEFFPNEDWISLLNLMKKYLDNKILNMDNVRESQKFIKENYSLEVWAKKIIECYNT